MPYLITSDIHGSAEGLELIRSAASRLGADGIISAGDQCPSSPDPLWSILIAVRGNCDRFYEYMGIPFPPLEREMALYGHRIVMTHGDRLCSDDYTLHRGDVFISGHTHVADLHQEDGVVFCNPGSPSRPRSSEGPTAALLSEEGVFLFSLLDFSTISAIRFS